VSLLGKFGVRFEEEMGLPFFGADRVFQRGLDVERWCDAVAKKKGCKPEDVHVRLVDGFFADDWAKRNRYPIEALLNNPHRYYEMKRELSGEERAAKLSNLTGRIDWLRTQIDLEDQPALKKHLQVQLRQAQQQRKELERG